MCIKSKGNGVFVFSAPWLFEDTDSRKKMDFLKLSLFLVQKGNVGFLSQSVQK